MKKLLSFVLCLLATTSVLASFVISPGLSYVTTEYEATQPLTVASEAGETRIDLKMGYVLPMGLYLGGMYSSISVESGGNSDSGNLIGPTIGYYSPMGFYTLLTYHIIGSLEAGSGTEYTGGKGPQIDVGWIFPISSFFAIGPQMTWRSVEFDKVETAGLSVDTDLKQTSIVPYLSLWFMF